MNKNLRKLGKTEIEITPIGLGVMQFAGGRLMFPEISQDTKNEIIKMALDGGINWFDTAEAYGNGISERGLANALKAAGKADDEVLVATKWSPFFRTAKNIPKTIMARQQYLSPYTIDLHQIHHPFSFSSPEDEMDAMADLVEAGKIRSVGVSNFSAKRMRRAYKALAKRGLPLASNQVQYSLLHRNIEINGVLDTAKELGITIIAWSPIASGILTGKFHKNPELLMAKPSIRRVLLQRRLEKSEPIVEVIDEIALTHQVTTAQIALNWLINYHGDTVVAIPGATRASHARESAGVMNFRLTEDEMSRIDEVSRIFR
ncbi:MAG: aldo/keto reductase [Anaerolineae bacterium SM23_ 63]|nr:MAG: aldo/keto reductase [Anaerolineae bacterium SM23_ 63]HEY45234.1 aldo/keto reductase [Anaerolineae bacterium]